MANRFGSLTIETEPLEWSQPVNLRSLKHRASCGAQRTADARRHGRPGTAMKGAR